MNNPAIFLNLLVAYMQIVSLKGTLLEAATTTELRRYLQPFGHVLMFAVGQSVYEPWEIRYYCGQSEISIHDFYGIVAAFVEHERITDALPVCAQHAYHTAIRGYCNDHPDKRPPKPAAQMIKAQAKLKEAQDDGEP